MGDESMGSSVLKTCCCSTCYGNSVVAEYFKQKKKEVAAGEPPTEGLSPDKDWMTGIKDQWYAGCCSCLLAKDMFEHVNESGMMGCFLRCFLPPVSTSSTSTRSRRTRSHPRWRCSSGSIECGRSSPTTCEFAFPARGRLAVAGGVSSSKAAAVSFSHTLVSNRSLRCGT